MNCLILNWSRTIRSQIAVSASASVFIRVGGIERFIFLDSIEEMTERLKFVDDLQRRLEETAYVHLLSTESVTKLSNEADIGSSNGERTGHWA